MPLCTAEVFSATPTDGNAIPDCPVLGANLLIQFSDDLCYSHSPSSGSLSVNSGFHRQT